MRRSFLLAALLVAVVAAGCSSDGSTSTDDTGSDESANEATAGGASGDGDAPQGAGDGEPVASAGCESGAAEAAVVEERRDLTVDGVERFYTVTTPETAGDEPLPVVFDFHGLAEGAQVHATMSQYSALAQEEGFLAVFPNGTGQPVRWNADDTSDTNPDLAYTDAMVEAVAAEHCVDTSRLYATGLSNGAMMTSLLMCTRADTFAAFAPVAGIRVATGCEPSRPVPVRAYHGTADNILTFDGRVGDGLDAVFGDADAATTTTTLELPDLDGDGYPANVRAWAEMNGCDPEPTDTEETAEVLRRVYDCPDGADVEFVIIVGGGHSWPGSEFSKGIADVVGYTTFDIDATRDSWAFFQQHQLPS